MAFAAARWRSPRRCRGRSSARSRCFLSWSLQVGTHVHAWARSSLRRQRPARLPASRNSRTAVNGTAGRPVPPMPRCGAAATLISVTNGRIRRSRMSMRDKRFVTFPAAAALLVLAALAVAGCGGGGSSNASSGPPKTASGQSATVGVANEGLGKILVNSQGRTLYLFRRDSGTKSECTGACAVDWPPLRATGKPTVGSGANASLIVDDQRPLGREAAGHLQRPPALPLLGRPEARRHQRPGPERLRRQLVRTVGRRRQGLQATLELRRRLWLLTRPRSERAGWEGRRSSQPCSPWRPPLRAAVAALRAAAARRPRRAAAMVGIAPPEWAANTDGWPAHNYDLANARATTNTNINATNVAKLTPAWRFKLPYVGQFGGLRLEPDRPERRRLHPGPELGRLRAEPADRRGEVEAPVQVADAERGPERPRTRLRDDLRRDRELAPSRSTRRPASSSGCTS